MSFAESTIRPQRIPRAAKYVKRACYPCKRRRSKVSKPTVTQNGLKVIHALTHWSSVMEANPRVAHASFDRRPVHTPPLAANHPGNVQSTWTFSSSLYTPWPVSDTKLLPCRNSQQPHTVLATTLRETRLDQVNDDVSRTNPKQGGSSIPPDDRCLSFAVHSLHILEY